MLNNKSNPNEGKVTLGPEVWQRVFNWRLYKHTISSLKQIFKNRSFGFADIVGVPREKIELIRGPVEPPLPFPFCELIVGTELGAQRCAQKQNLARAAVTSKPNT